MTTEFAEEHRGGDFSPSEPTARGGPDYGRFVEAVRTLQDHARAADAPDDVITEAADLLEKASNAAGALRRRRVVVAVGPPDGPAQPGQRAGHPGGLSRRPTTAAIGGTAQFRRFHLGRNGAVHGGCIAQLFDSLLGYTAFRLTRSLYQRTAFLHVDYRKIVPIETKLQVDAGVDRVDGRKMFVAGRLLDGEVVLAEANALFVKLNPGQP